MLTTKAWARLWERRPDLGDLSGLVNRVAEHVGAALADDTLMDVAGTFRPALRHLAGQELTITMVDGPGVHVYRRYGDAPEVVMNEGFVRYVVTMFALGLFPTLGRRPDASPFLTGAAAANYSDDQRVARTAAAYCGTLYETGGTYLPVSVNHTPLSASLTDTMALGALAFAATHELGHLLVDFELRESRDSEMPRLLKSNRAAREAYCDTTAAVLCALALAKLPGEGTPTLALAGSTFVPVLLGLLDDLRFVLLPDSHPSGEYRSEAVEAALRTLLPDDAVDEIYQVHRVGFSFSVLHIIARQLQAIDWVPRSANHLANALEPTGPIQFRLACGQIGDVDPSEDDEENSSLLCSMGIAGAEEALRRRSLSTLHQFATIGALLCGGVSPTEVLTEPVATRVLDDLVQRNPQISSGGADLESPAVRDTFVAAVIGQHVFYTQFVRTVFDDVDPENPGPFHGYTHDELAYRARELPEAIVHACIAVVERRRRGEDLLLRINEALAETVCQAVAIG